MRFRLNSAVRALRCVAVIALCLVAAACQASPRQTQFSVALANQPSRQPATGNQATGVPTARPLASRTPTLVPTATFTPTLTPTDTLTPTHTATPTVSPTALAINSPTPGGEATEGTTAPTWTPPPDDPATRIQDHYHFIRPIPEGNTNWVDRTYPYGGTQGGNLLTHLGVEFVNPRGIPILAVADGEVVYAGGDEFEQFGPITNYYGFLVIIRHDFLSPEGQAIYSLYGHMARWDVEIGQRVAQGDQIGIVGGTGVALGPHLHFEVRAGDYRDFRATRNPELWIYPFRGYGVLAGRVTDANGNRLYEVTIQVRSTDIARYAFTYADDTVNPDPTFGEHFTLGDLPANYYEIVVRDSSRLRYQNTIYVYPNRTTWIDIQLN